MAANVALQLFSNVGVGMFSRSGIVIRHRSVIVIRQRTEKRVSVSAGRKDSCNQSVTHINKYKENYNGRADGWKMAFKMAFDTELKRSDRYTRERYRNEDSYCRRQRRRRSGIFTCS